MKKTTLTVLLFASILHCQAQEPKLMIPMGHAYQVKEAFFSKDDTYIITVAENVKVWEASTGKLICNIVHDKLPNDAVLLKDNKTIIISYPDSVRFLDLSKGKFQKSVAGMSATVFEDHNKIIVLSYSDEDPSKTENAKLYDLKSLKILHQFDLPVASFSRTTKSFLAVDINKIRLYDSTFQIIYSRDGGNVAGVSDGFNLLAVQLDSTLEIIDTRKNVVLQTFSTDLISKYSVRFLPDSNRMILKVTPMKIDGGYTMQADDTYFLSLDMDSFVIRNRFIEQAGNISGFEVNNRFVASSSSDSTIRFWDPVSGDLKGEFKDPSGISNNITFSHDYRYIVSSSNRNAAKVWDVEKMKQHLQLEQNASYVSRNEFSKDGNLLLVQRDNDIWLWNIRKGAPHLTLPANQKQTVSEARLNATSSRLFVSLREKGITTMEKGGAFSFLSDELLKKQMKIHSLSANDSILIDLPARFNGFAPSPDGNSVFIYSLDSTAELISVSDTKKIIARADLGTTVADVHWMPGDSHITVLTKKGITQLDQTTLKPLQTFYINAEPSGWAYSTASGLAVYITNTRKLVLANVNTGKTLAEFNDYIDNTHNYVYSELNNPVADSTGRYFCLRAPESSSLLILDSQNPRALKKISLDSYPTSLLINSSNKLLIGYAGGKLETWDIPGGKLLSNRKYETEYIDAISGQDQFLIGHRNAEVVLINNKNHSILHTLYLLPGNDYIVTDSKQRYDGSERGRKSLYFTCGTEIIELEQVKDQLWVPGLASRLMKGEAINAKTAEQLSLCELTPLTKSLGERNGKYEFTITPRRGGLGDIIIQVNGIEVSRVAKNNLKKSTNGFILSVSKTDVSKYFVSGSINRITVRAMTEDNIITSRSTVIDEEADQRDTEPPNLYAVIVGVSDYKGDELDLHFAAKDARDFADAVELTATKLLNSPGKSHVFMYRLHTDEGRDRFPEKNSIRLVFEEIGKKAKPNDVLLVFFAGHGKMETKSNQFHFITADASKSTLTAALNDVSISSRELMEWIQPSVMKAQKRILIFDACNSGQAIKDIVKLGDDGQQFSAARDDEQAEQLKAIEKMNERSGLFILSASASDQKAYEMSRFSQGVLTYSLLQAIKQQPDILTNQKYLNVTKWFAAAERTVGDIARESNARQQAQMVSTTNFDIGIVDDDVRTRIILPQEKLVFSSSEFRNSETKFDNLQFRNKVDKQLNIYGDSGPATGILFRPGVAGKDVYSITGDYTVSGESFNVSILLIKGGTSLIQKFEVKGTLNGLDEIAIQVVKGVFDFLSKKN